MKFIFGNFILVVWVILFYYLVRSSKHKDSEGRILQGLFFYGFFAVMCQIAISHSNQQLYLEIAYNFYYIFLDWMVFYFFLFCVQFSGEEKLPAKTNFVAGMILGVDSFFLMTNVFHHLEYYDEAREIGGEMYLAFTWRPLFYFHLFLSYILCVAAFWILIRTIRRVPSIYRAKYIMVMGLFLIVMVLNGVHIAGLFLLDVSIILYGIFAIYLFYYTYIISPHRILGEAWNLVLAHFNEALIIWDLDGHPIFANEKAKNYFGEISRHDLFLETAGFHRDGWTGNMSIARHPMKLNERDAVCDVDYEEIYDNHGKLVTTFVVVDDVTEQVQHEAEERYAARHDLLTGLYNKYYFFTLMKEWLKKSDEETHYVMIVSDLYNFKLINETYGMEAGDSILRGIADNLIKNVPEGGGIYCRYEADKFALLLDKKYFTEEIFNTTTSSIFQTSSNILTFTQYYGVYDVVDKTLSPNVICDRAMMALKSVKGEYNRYFGYYVDSLRDSAIAEKELMEEINAAIANGELIFYLQPQVSPKLIAITGAEALIRWKHPEEGLIPPGKFLPFLEKSGAIEKVDRYIWEEVCKLLRKWKDEGHEERTISVNISPKDFYFINIRDFFTDIVKKYDISPKSIKLEITESAIMLDADVQIKLIEDLIADGFIIEMDDFGSGYSSLNMLKDIPVQVLKLDRSFIYNPKDEARSRDIVRSVTYMAHALGMKIIAEGVEDEEQKEFLKSIDCESIQGFFYSKPLPVEEYEAMLAEWPYEDLMHLL